MKRFLLVVSLMVWFAAPPLPNPACVVPVPFHCDPPPNG